MFIIILMTDADRNTRTLILCFTLALMGLIPLRFVEAGQNRLMERPMVLGETVVVREVVESRSPAILEVPYDKIDGPSLRGTDCLSVDEAGRIIDEMTRGLVSGDYDEVEITEMISEAEEVEARMCR